MAHKKYGDKYTCYQCGTKFFTMGKPKPVCPKCDANQRRAPKKSSFKVSKPLVVEDLEATEETTEGDLNDFPIKEEEEEVFDPNSDRLSVDGVPDQEY